MTKISAKANDMVRTENATLAHNPFKCLERKELLAELFVGVALHLSDERKTR